MAGQTHDFVLYAPERIPYATEPYVKETHRPIRCAGPASRRTCLYRRRRIHHRRHGILSMDAVMERPAAGSRPVSKYQALDRNRGATSCNGTRLRKERAVFQPPGRHRRGQEGLVWTDCGERKGIGHHPDDDGYRVANIRHYDLAGADPERRFSPFCWRTKLALAHKGLPVETIPWRFTDKDVIAFSSQGRVPVLVDGDKTVFDSWGSRVISQPRIQTTRRCSAAIAAWR